VAAILERTGFPPDLLELELTESVLVQDTPEGGEAIATLRKLGVNVAIDDFGTGYASLTYLRRFNATTLKIDRSFINTMLTEQGDLAIVRASIALGHAFGLKVIAEGVETEAQRDFLRTLGCDQAQGYLINPPLNPDAFVAQLAKRRMRRKPALKSVAA